MTEKSNYRPISVLPVISKLFEKLVKNQLYQYMNDNGHFPSGQCGSLRLNSTVTSLFKNIYDWHNGMGLGGLVGLVFINLKTAFETVDHNILCQKLKHYSVEQKEHRKLVYHKAYVLTFFSSSSKSTISLQLYKILSCQCMLMTPVCATTLMI